MNTPFRRVPTRFDVAIQLLNLSLPLSQRVHKNDSMHIRNCISKSQSAKSERSVGLH